MSSPIKPSLHTSKVIKQEPLDPKDAQWTSLQKITYLDPHSTPRIWESCSRPTRPSTSPIDSVGIVAILHHPSHHPSAPPRIVLQKQFRPPVGRVVIELPAGLVDEGETAVECATRELKEETGYVGEVEREEGWAVSPIMFNDPGFCTTNLQMIHLTVDLSNPLNQNPIPSLTPDEFIETFDVPLKDLWVECAKLEREGYAIDARVATLAEGIEGARRWRVWG